MPRDPRYDILFEPVRIGSHLAKNRFFQVPHCNGMGTKYPRSMTAMRRMKAEGGWAVVCTEETEIDPTTDMSPLTEGRLWHDRDIPTYAAMVEGIHEHCALAGIELSHAGHRDANLYSREVPRSVGPYPVAAMSYPAQARRMDLADIRAYRMSHRAAAVRAMQAGFDIVYVYCRVSNTLNGMFLSAQYNDRSDEYGGSFANRLRLLREVLEETHSAIGHKCAVALRFTVDDLKAPDGTPLPEESRAVVEELAEMPDLWDVNVATWARDSLTSRFGPEGHQEDRISWVKPLTTKPVVGVGRFTSPDTMASQVRRGVVDFVGAARPSIADPFLPRKIEEGRIDDIRECIGCNICASADATMVPLRCTQNPTMGEEYRKGWHPEKVSRWSGGDESILIVGGGPTGLEAALTLARRGANVTLAEASDSFGGRVSRESRLPGLAEWARVRDWRLGQLQNHPNCALYLQSEIDADTALAFEATHILVATGASWRRDGTGRAHLRPISLDGTPVFTPDDLMAGRVPEGRVVIHDDDHYYMASVLAEVCAKAGCDVTLVTTAAEVAPFARATLEQELIERRMLEIGVRLIVKHRIEMARQGAVRLSHVNAAQIGAELPCDALVLVTSRASDDALYRALVAKAEQWEDHGVASVALAGDCDAPSTIAAAVYAGHRFARELDQTAESPELIREFF